MRKFSKIFLVFFCLSVLISVTGCAPESIGNIGENEMKVYEYQFFLLNAKNQVEQTNGAYGQQLWATEENVTYLKELAMENLKVHKIMLAEAKKNSFKLSDEKEKEINEGIEQEIKENGGEKEFLVKLEQNYEGITLEDYKKLKYDVNYSTEYTVSIMDKLEITDDEIKELYEKDKDKYDYKVIRHVLLSTITESGTKKSDAEIKKAKEKADEILVKVNNGEDMEKLVQDYSEYPGKTQNNGDIRIGKNSDLGADYENFQNWGIGAEPGDTGIVETIMGYHVVKCISKSSLEDEEFKATIKFEIQNTKMTKTIEDLANKSEYRVVQNKQMIDDIKIPGV